MTDLASAGTKGGDISTCINILKLRGTNPQDHFKKEDVQLACKCVKAGCSVADTKTMLELVARQHKNTELQTVFNANSDIRNKPTEFLLWVNKGLNPQLIIFLHKFKCSPGMRDHIRDYLPTISKTTLSELSGG